MTDLVVVGGGVAGCLAALRAVRVDPSASVTLVAPATERFDAETGLIDLLGYTPDGEGPIARPLYKIRTLPDDHPYSRLGLRTVQDALGLFDEVFGPGEAEEADANWPALDGLGATAPDGRDAEGGESITYHSGATAVNALVPTANGRIKPTSRYPAAVAGGLASDERPMRIVGFEQETHLDASVAAGRLDDLLPYDVSSTTIRFPAEISESPPAPGMARALDDDVAGVDGRPVRESVADRLLGHVDVEPRIGFPAVLGLERSERVRAGLESRLQADVFEIPIGPPSVPGRRLRRRLLDAVAEAGVSVERDTPVTGFEASDGRLTSIHLGGGERTVDASAVVLATGGLDAGGLVGTRSEIREPIFGCHVAHPSDRGEWTAAEFLGDHPFARFGVEITDDLRPLGEDGEPVYGNLRAAGTIIGGWDFTAEHSRAGVAIATGSEAGKLSVEDSP